MYFIDLLQPAAVAWLSFAWQMSAPPHTTLTDPFTQWAWRKPQSHFCLSPHTKFYDWFSEYSKANPGRGRLPGQQTNTALFTSVFSGHPRTQRCYIIRDLSFNRKVPFMLHSPSLAAHQIVITSCKAICSENLCWWPPVFKRGPGLRSADDFSKPPS